MNNDELATRLHSIANHPALPPDAAMDIDQAAFILVRQARQIRDQQRAIQALKQELGEPA